MNWMVSLIPIGVTVSHVGLQQDCRSIRCNKFIVLWRSRTQKTIALSTSEAEYYSSSVIAVEIIHLRNLIRNMDLPQDDDTPVYEDNTT
jgi:hypothetical protein